MPSFVIATSQHCKAGKTINAVLCGLDATGQADQRTVVPVKAMISEKAIRIDDEPRPRVIISARTENGATRYLVAGSTKAVRNAARRAALAKALAQLQLLATSLRPLQATSEEPDLAIEGLGLLFNWLADERERLTEGSHHE